MVHYSIVQYRKEYKKERKTRSLSRISVQRYSLTGIPGKESDPNAESLHWMNVIKLKRLYQFGVKE